MFCMLPLLAFPAVDGIDIVLTSGTVTGSERGQGKAVAEACVTNNTSRALYGVRIGVYYALVDALPAADADYRVHEFIFEPPLAPGKSSILHFSDENAGEYVLLDVQRANFNLGLTYNGLPAQLAQPLMARGGADYIATRELMNLIGGSISYDSKLYMIVLERRGIVLRLKPNLDYALLGETRVPLAHPVIESGGRSMVPLQDIAQLLGLSVMRNAEQNAIELSDPQ